MSHTVQSNGNFTGEPVAKVFAAVVEGLKKTYRNTYSAEEVEHLAKLVESVQDNPQWKGVSANFISYGITNRIKDAANAGKDAFSLTSLTADNILSSLMNHGGQDRPKPVVREIQTAASITSLDEHKKKLQEKRKLPHHPITKQDAIWVGIYSLMAGMSLYDGIVRGIDAMKAPREEGESRPFMPYVISAAQLALGVGMASLAHGHYQTATRGH